MSGDTGRPRGLSRPVLTPAELAEVFDVSEAQVMEWRRIYSWPSFKIGRKVRFTSDHVAQIIASHSVKDSAIELKPTAADQTSRSARQRKAS